MLPHTSILTHQLLEQLLAVHERDVDAIDDARHDRLGVCVSVEVTPQSVDGRKMRLNSFMTSSSEYSLVCERSVPTEQGARLEIRK